MPDSVPDTGSLNWSIEEWRLAQLRYEERMLDARNATQELLESAVEDSINEIRFPAPSSIRWEYRERRPGSYDVTEPEDDIPPVEDVPYTQTIFVGTDDWDSPLVIKSQEGDVLVEVLRSGEIKAKSIPDLEEAIRLIAENYGYWDIPEDRVWEPQLD